MELWKKSKIAWFSNMYHNIISIILGLEECEITWYSNTCYTFQPEHTWEAEEIAEFSNKDVGGFAL